MLCSAVKGYVSSKARWGRDKMACWGRDERMPTRRLFVCVCLCVCVCVFVFVFVFVLVFVFVHVRVYVYKLSFRQAGDRMDAC